MSTEPSVIVSPMIIREMTGTVIVQATPARLDGPRFCALTGFMVFFHSQWVCQDVAPW